MAFIKGQSGNPGGVPKMDAEFRERCRRAVDMFAVQRWIDSVKNGDEGWQLSAEKLASYGYGKPHQSIELDASITTVERRTGNLAIEKLEALVGELEAKALLEARLPTEAMLVPRGEED